MRLSRFKFGANEWRIEWSLRTCISTAASAFLCLYIPTRAFLNDYGHYEVGPPIGCFVNIIVKDNTLGGSIANAWGCLYGSFLACFVCFILQIVFPYSFISSIIFLFLLCFVLMYLELNLLGKKLSLSICALLLLPKNPNPYNSWFLFLNCCIGIVTGLIGNIIPVPRVAYDEVEMRAVFSAEAIGTIIDDILIAWRYSSAPIETGIDSRPSNNNFFGRTSIRIDPSLTQTTLSSRLSTFKHHRLLIKLSNIFLALAAFKNKNKKLRMFWSSNRNRHKKNVYMRLEVMRFLGEVTDSMQALIADSRFGPYRDRAIVRHALFLTLVKDFTLVIGILEQRLRDIRHQPQFHHVINAFHDRADFRAAISSFVEALKSTLILSATWLSELGTHPSDQALQQIAKLTAARAHLDAVYIKARMDIYYNVDPMKAKVMSSFVAMNMNSFMCMLDTTYMLVKHNYFDVFINKQSSYKPNWMERLSERAANVRADLFPSQRALFKLVNNRPTPQMITRFKQAASLALSMVVAGIYGHYAGRQQVFMAAFTIAYLTGGIVSGANAVTSMNRATGTVAGSVYAVIVTYIVSRWDVVRANVFIFFAIVLFQVPCTYVRTLPLYGYSGTVSGFTAAILLLMPSLNQQAAVDRIIDTYVGVFIFIIIDTWISANYSEEALLNDVNRVFLNIKQHFSEFIEMFKNCHGSSPKLQRSVLIADITHGKAVSLFSSSVPLPWRPPPLEKRIIDELMTGQEAAHRSIQGMMWALTACNRGENADFHYMLLDLRDDMKFVSAFVDMACSYLQSIVHVMGEWREMQHASSDCSVLELVNGEYKSGVFASNVTDALTSRYTLLSTGEEESDDVKEFFARIEELVQRLQQSFREAPSSTSPDENEGEVTTAIISNEEVKTVNSVLACTKDLLDALRAISAAMTRLRVYRDIRITQSGSRALNHHHHHL